MKKWEAADLGRHLLAGLGERCGQIIRLQHVDGVSDEEVVHQRLAKYSTPDSLKIKRRGGIATAKWFCKMIGFHQCR
jgi:hypothetical protein